MNPADAIRNMPAWAVEAFLALIGAIAKMVKATTDDEREEALMQAAEAAKKAADARKFGG